MVQLELEGRLVGYRLGFGGDDSFAPFLPVPGATDIMCMRCEVLRYLDSAFVLMFLAELLLRAVLEGRLLFFDYANWFDMFLVHLGLHIQFATLQVGGLGGLGSERYGPRRKCSSAPAAGFEGFQGLPDDPELPTLSWAASSGEGVSVLPVLFILVHGDISCI